MRSTVLRGNKFIEALKDAGLVPKYTTRITITANYDSVVELEYECLAQENLIQVVPGMEIEGAARAGA
jgi:hypothetical protein